MLVAALMFPTFGIFITRSKEVLLRNLKNQQNVMKILCYQIKILSLDSISIFVVQMHSRVTCFWPFYQRRMLFYYYTQSCGRELQLIHIFVTAHKRKMHPDS